MAGETAGQPVIVTLPREIDLNNSDAVRGGLLALLDNPALVIADMSGTIFSDTSGLRMLVLARNHAESSGATLRIVIRPGSAVARSLSIMGFDRVLPIYHSIQDATQACSGSR
jgi:anti-anti-sigma factor